MKTPAMVGAALVFFAMCCALVVFLGAFPGYHGGAWGDIQDIVDLGLIGEGLVPAGVVSVDVMHKFGHVLGVGTGAFETVWSEGGPYPGWLDSAVTMSIASTDADDTALGTGARTVQIYGHDGDLLELDPLTVALNGQTPVEISVDLRRALRVVVVTAGSSNGNEGIIRIGVGAFVAGVPPTVYARVDAPDSAADGDEMNQTLLAMWTCPSDASCLMTAIDLHCSGDCSFRLKRRDLGGLWRTVRIGDALAGDAQALDNGYRQVVSGGADVECQVKSLAGGPIDAGCAIAWRIYRGL